MPRGALPQLIAHEIAVALFDHIAEMNADAVARVAAAEAAPRRQAARARFSNTSYATGMAEKAFGQPT